MPRPGDSRFAVLEALEQRYGPLPRPGIGPVAVDRSLPFEAIAAVALGLVANLRTAADAFDVLREAGLLDPQALSEADFLELDDLFKQARIRLAARSLKPLQRIARWATARAFDPESVDRLSTQTLRDDWRGLNGVGPATADALLLYGLGRVAYPVDRASYRILVRHGWLDPSSDYDEARLVLEAIAPDDPQRLAQLSLALERLGRDTCKPGTPRCDGCPLQSLLPEGGPIEES